MARKSRVPVTPAVRVLRAAGLAFDDHPYAYVPGGGTAQFARVTGTEEHQVIKTLVMEDESGAPFLMLMHGDCEVASGRLARAIGAKRVGPCDPAVAERHTGYQVGGISPFGTRRPLPVYHEASIATQPRLYLNGGKRGYILSLDPSAALALLQSRPVRAAC